MSRVSRINTALVVAIFLVNGYVVLTPLMPAAVFWLQRHNQAAATRLEQELRSPALSKTVRPQDNRLVVPAMGLSEPIYDGPNQSTLNNGLWRLPTTSDPSRGSNTVIVGHRFTYTNPRGTFYHLDQVKVGDKIGVFWQGKKYLYEVDRTAVVPATAVEVEAPTNKPTLTLYTCAPLWWPKDRLVVTASLEEL